MEMEATRPLLAPDGDDGSSSTTPHGQYYYQLHNGHSNGHAGNYSPRRRGSLLILDETDDESCCARCSRVICCLSSSTASPSSGYKELPPHRDAWLSDSTVSSSASSGSQRSVHTNDWRNWGCWKWMFPDRVCDYEDFVTPEVMGEVHYIRQKTREFFDASNAEDAEMVQHLWNALFPTLPYDGRVNARWRDVGFQNDDPASDFRSSGRFGLKMLLYFADHMNDEFKRLVRENRFPVCLCALNVIEMLLIHLNFKDPLPLVCPCCGTKNAELDTSNPGRDRPELKGFLSILTDCSWSAKRSSQLIYASEWPIEVAFAQVFMHSMIVLDGVWKQQLQRDPTRNLMHFRDALFDTCKKTIAFLSRRNSPVDLVELAAWSARYKNATPSNKTKKPGKQ